MPKRIQRKRTKGWKMPRNTVYVGRPTKWGNPYRPKKGQSAEQCVALYRELVTERNIWTEPNQHAADRELRGKNLACWCKIGEPCHADVLLELANR
jgi:hypothetical protein